MTATTKTADERPLRADAARNRASLLAAAHAVFSESGASASMEDVARRAGVGIGTLYRHFPTREALLAAACDERLLAIVRESGGDAGDPGDAFTHYLETLVASASLYRGLAASFGVVLHAGTAGCHATTEEGERLLARAQKARRIRRDLVLDDVVCVAIAIALATPGDPARVRRLIAVFLDGMRLPG